MLFNFVDFVKIKKLLIIIVNFVFNFAIQFVYMLIKLTYLKK